MKSIAQMCREAGIDRKTYYNRLKKGEADLLRPVKRNKRRTLTENIKRLLKDNNIRHDTYFARLKLGWSEFEASHIQTGADWYHFYKGKSVFSLLDRYKYNRYMLLYHCYGPDKAIEYLERRLNE